MIRRLAVLALAVAGLLAILAPADANADMAGFRWSPERKICIHYAGAHPTWASYSVSQWNALPELTLVLRVGSASCSLYSQRVNIVEYRYSASEGRSAWTNYTGTMFPTPCAQDCTGTGWYWGPDAGGDWSYLLKSPVTIHINTRKAWTAASYRGMVTHELGHAWGENHTTRCDSVMSTTCFSKAVPTAYDRAEIARVYP